MIKNVHGNTVDLLGEAIVSGRYPVGGVDTAGADAVRRSCGVSRTVVREAIKSLVAKGMIVTGPKVGTRVLPDDEWNWFDPDVIYLAGQAPASRLSSCATCKTCAAWWSQRPSSWPPSAPRAAGHRRASRLAYAGMKRAVEDGGDYVTFDLRFHQGLLRAAHNRMLVQMSKALGALLRTSFEISTAKKDGPTIVVAAASRGARCGDRARTRSAPRSAILKLIDGARDDIEKVLGSRRRLPRLSRPAAAGSRRR